MVFSVTPGLYAMSQCLQVSKACLTYKTRIQKMAREKKRKKEETEGNIKIVIPIARKRIKEG